MHHREHGEQRQLVAGNALSQLRALGIDVHRTERIVVDFNGEQPLERTHQTGVSNIDDECRAASNELRGLVCLNDIVADL